MAGMFMAAILIATLIAFHADANPGTKVGTKFSLKSILGSKFRSKPSMADATSLAVTNFWAADRTN
jgi:hypothetical protein